MIEGMTAIETIRREMTKAIAAVEIARLRKHVAMCWMGRSASMWVKVAK
jgi:hypothetical protein